MGAAVGAGSVTRLWPEGASIDVTAGADERPLRFAWQGRTHEVDAITREWRVSTDWWRGPAWRAYFKLTTTSGMLVILYRDLGNDQWYLQRIFD